MCSVATWQVEITPGQLGPRSQIQYGACTVGILAWSIIDMSEVNNTYWSIIGGVRYYDTNIMGVGNVFIVGWGGGGGG